MNNVSTKEISLLKQTIFTKKELNTKVSDYEIRKMIKNDELEHAGHGIYSLSNNFPDPFKIQQSKYRKGVYCLNTALYLWGYSDRYPERLDMMFPHGYNTSKISYDILSHTQIKNLFEQDVTTTTTIDGNEIKLYSLERTLAEILRPRNYVDPEVITSAYRQWAKKKDKDVNRLVYFAQEFKTINQAQNYLEVLL